MLRYVFKLIIRDGLTAATFDDIKELVMTVYGDGSDKHQHRATAEILGALISSITNTNVEKRAMVWEFIFPIVREIVADGLTPENLGYWITFLRMIMKGRDLRCSWPIIDYLAGFRLDMSSNAAFKESSTIDDFLARIDQGVRDAMGLTLATIFRTRHHESFQGANHFIEAQHSASSVGTQPY
jgi:proteasome activator subunit 4